MKTRFPMNSKDLIDSRHLKLGIEPADIHKIELSISDPRLDDYLRIGILNLMLRLKEERDLAFLYVTHDLGSARYVADDILVMYAGQIVERGPVEQVLAEPLHPYTRLLLASVPDPASGLTADRIEQSAPASAAVDPSDGCRFLPRCPLAIAVCSELTPRLVEARRAQAARCHVTAPSTT